MIDMLGHVSQPFNTQPQGGVLLIPPVTDGYYDDNGEYVEGASPEPVAINEANIQPASRKTIEFMIGMGGTANPRDIRDVYINDGTTYVFPEDTGRPADMLAFSDGLNIRLWRVMHSDNRPWHNYCHVIVERTREIYVPPAPDAWLLSGGLWDDSGVWSDSESWDDGDTVNWVLSLGLWNDSGEWNDNQEWSDA